MGWSKVIIMILLLMPATTTQAQTFGEWFQQKKTQIAYYAEQIAALKAHRELLRQGYGIVQDGLQVARDLRKGEFDLHEHYFQSLQSVNASLKTDEAEKVFGNIIRQCEVVRSLAEHLPEGQQQYVVAVMNTLTRKASQNYRGYEQLTTPAQYQLTDDQRMRRIEASLNAFQDQYAFVKRFCYGLQKMILQEVKERHVSQSLHQIFAP